MGRWIFLVAVAGMALAATPVLAQTLYRWVDANGKTHYTATPPAPGQAREVRELPGGTSSSPAPKPGATPSTWQEKELEFRRRRLEAEASNAEEERRVAAAKRAAAERREACIAARTDLEALESDRPVYTLDEKGDRVYIEDSARGAAIEAAKRVIAQFCG